MPRYVVRKPALSAKNAMKAVKQTSPNAINMSAKIDPKRKCRRGHVYKVTFTLKKRRKR